MRADPVPVGAAVLADTVAELQAENVPVLRAVSVANTQHGTTILFVTHNVAPSERCDRTIEVIAGRVIGE